MLDGLEPGTRFDPEPLEFTMRHAKDRLVTGFDGFEFAFASEHEVAAAELDAHRRLPGTARLGFQHDARLPRLVAEMAADLPLSFELVVLVVADHDAAFQGGKARKRVVQAEFRHELRLLENDPRTLLAVFVLVILVLALFMLRFVLFLEIFLLAVGVFADDAVGPIPNGNCSPEVSAFAVVCGAEGTTGVVAETVLQNARYWLLVLVVVLLFLVMVLLFLVMVGIKSRVAGYRQIPVLAGVAVQVPSPLAAASVQANAGVAGVGAVVSADEHATR